MSAKAIEKLQSEMAKDTANSYIQVVGGFLIQHLEQNPQDAEKIHAKENIPVGEKMLVEDKTIAKSLEEMKKVASKKKVGNCAVLTDQEGFAAVLKYFGIGTEPAEYVPKPVESVTEKAKSVTSSTSFDISLEDLL
jgi:hypothetical protein